MAPHLRPPAPPAPVSELRDGEPASLVGTITDAEIVSRTPGKSVFGAIVENESGAVRILFFNQPFRAEQLTLDRRVIVSGTSLAKPMHAQFAANTARFSTSNTSGSA